MCYVSLMTFANLLEARSTDEVTRLFCTRHNSVLNSSCHIAVTFTLWVEISRS